MIDPKFDHCRPLRYTLLAFDVILIAWLVYYAITRL